MKRTFALLLLLHLLVFAVLFPVRDVYSNDFMEDEPFTETFSNPESNVAAYPKIDSAAAIVMDTISGRVLYEKNAYSKRSVASTTKIITAILAIEKGNLEDKVAVSKRAASIRGSNIGLKQGQVYTLRELLYGLLLNSGNDAAIAIAEYIGGTVEGFAEMMNSKAAMIGARSSHFISPHGLDMEGHYSTAYDLALIARYALRNPVFSEIVSAKTAVISNKSLHNTNEMLSAYPGADGVKTGYTGKAGRCLVTSATRDNWRIISVVLGCPSRYKRAQSSSAILDYVFFNYKPYILARKNASFKRVPVRKGVDDSISVRAVENIIIPLSDSERRNIEMQVNLPDRMEAPVSAGMKVGSVRFVVNGKLLAGTDLVVENGVRRKGFLDYIGGIFKVWIRISREGMFLEP